MFKSGFPGGQEVKNSPTGDTGSVPGLGRSPGGGHATRSSALAWRIPWPEEPGGLQPLGSQRAGHEATWNAYMLKSVIYLLRKK